MRIVCFADWRVQEIHPLIDFVKGLSPRPDLIIYAGDDTERFAEWNHPVLQELFARGISTIISNDEMVTNSYESIVDYMQLQMKKPLNQRNRRLFDFFDYFEKVGKFIYGGDDEISLEEFIEDFLNIRSRTIRNDDILVRFQLRDTCSHLYLTVNYFKELAKLAKHGVYAVIGNDCTTNNKALISSKNWKRVHDLAEQRKIINKFAFLGLEGVESIASTLDERLIHDTDDSRNVSTDIGRTIYPEETYREQLRVFNHNRYNNKFKIIISHGPPFKVLDLAKRFGACHLGSKALRETIEGDSNVKLVICGHVHLYGGKSEKLNGATVVNCASHDGEGSVGNVATIDLDNQTGEVANITWNRVGGILEEIWYVGPKRASLLREAGFRGLTDMVDCEAAEIHSKINGKLKIRTIEKIQARCRALIRNELVFMKHSPAEIPRIDDWAMVDIETSVDQKEIWCIGVLYKDDFYPFFLDIPGDKEQIQAMFTGYLDLLEEIQKQQGLTTICCYSKTRFDFRVIDNLLAEHDLQRETYQSLTKHDLYNLMTDFVVFPLSGFGLKVVAEYLGFLGELDPNYDGLAASADYYRTFTKSEDEKVKQDMKKKLLLYNEEDTRKMVYIWKRLEQWRGSRS